MFKNGVLVLIAVFITTGVAFGAGNNLPAIITSAGQGPDGLIVKVLLDRELAGLDVELPYIQAAVAEDVKDISTMLVVVGVSSKGLGAAGINLNQEVARVEQLLKDAVEGGTRIILVHSGGAGRRGSSTDKMTLAIIPYVDQIVVLEAGNEDGFFTDLGERGRIPVISAADRNELGSMLAAIFAE